MQIIGLTAQGRRKLEGQIAAAGRSEEVVEDVLPSLIGVITRQMNSPTPTSRPPWYFAVGKAGTAFPTTEAEREASEYEEICVGYETDDLIIQPVNIR